MQAKCTSGHEVASRSQRALPAGTLCRHRKRPVMAQLPRGHAVQLQAANAATAVAHSGADRNTATLTASSSASSSPVFRDLLLVWTQLSDRLSQSREGVFEAGLLLRAVKLVISSMKLAGTLPDGRMPVQRSIALAMVLADCAAAGMPVDATTLAAAVVADGVCSGHVPIERVHSHLGMEVCVVVHEVQRVRQAAQTLPLYDGHNASSLREMFLALSDVRGILVEVIGHLDLVQHASGLRSAKKQSLALRGLQVFAPLGHALGLSVLSTSIEASGLSILFPGSFRSVEGWLDSHRQIWLQLLCRMRSDLLDALSASKVLRELGAEASITIRAKSSVSTMKKLLELSDFERGGRSPGEVYDVLGMRIIVDAAPGRTPTLPDLEAACHRIETVIASLWEAIPARRKDYISRPKANGYQSLHMAVRVPGGTDVEDKAAVLASSVELQIRSAAMHVAAEHGASAHFAYKGGLDRSQTTRMQDWTQQLMRAANGCKPSAIGSAVSGWDATGAAALHTAASSQPVPSASISRSASPYSSPPQSNRLTLPPPHRDLLDGDSGGAVPEYAQAAARELFDHIDRDGDGTITVAELQLLLRELGEEAPEAQAQRLAAVLASEPGQEDCITFADLWGFYATAWGGSTHEIAVDDGARRTPG